MTTETKTGNIVQGTSYTKDDIADNLSFEFLEQEFSEVLAKIKVLEAEKAVLREGILAKFEKTYGHQSQSFINKDTLGKLNRVLQVTQEVDQDKIKKLLTKEQFTAVAVATVDKEKLLAAISIGFVNPATVAEALQTKEVDKLGWSKVK